VTVAHEFKHASQYSYTAWSEGNWVELDATWVEDIVYDRTNDYYNYIFGADSPFTNPELPLDNGGAGLYEDANWEHYQTEKLGNAEMLAWWTRRLSFPGEAVLTTAAELRRRRLASATRSAGTSCGDSACGALVQRLRLQLRQVDHVSRRGDFDAHRLAGCTTGGTVNHLAANTRLVLTGGAGRRAGVHVQRFFSTPWRSIVALARRHLRHHADAALERCRRPLNPSSTYQTCSRWRW
jgi:hypothetical protein